MGRLAEGQEIAERLGVRYLTGPATHSILFSFVTLVASQERYDRMLTSALAKGFMPENSEFLALDNRGANRFDGFDAMRRALVEARGRYIVFTHDDIEFTHDGAAELEARLDELGALDPDWLLAGNAGGIGYRRGKHHLAVHIDDPHKLGLRVTQPELVESLDENFFVMRRNRPVVNSYDLEGFHFYAGDLCRMSEIMGGRSYVIPFLLSHHSGGKVDEAFPLCRSRFERKYRRYFVGRNLQMTVAEFRFGLAGMREGWGETPKSRWDFLKRNVYAPERSGVDDT